ncbi:MAG: nucleotide sugar dehydrogenase [Luteitalea sp.]|nr:nucleotide sugar dehydrogenase [Luteitalea sp.]
MKVLVWGLGYVGTVSAACLAHLGHEVIGIDPVATKVDALNDGRSAVKEPGLDDLVNRVVRDGFLRATSSGGELVETADVSLICVGTPSGADGTLSLGYIQRVGDQIGDGLRRANNYHVVVMRSTVLPGTIRQVLMPQLEGRSGREAGRDFGVASNPEFMRETSAIADFQSPPYTVIGALDPRSCERVAELYQSIAAPLHTVALEQAELLKIVNNTFHALKVGFANEIGRLCGELALDGGSLMRLVCADTKLNISPRYLQPGFAFGGSCLPKDLRALASEARDCGISLPIIDAILPSNRAQIETARAKAHRLGAVNIAVLGLGFKPGTDDLRESPTIELIRSLWQDGLNVLVHDPDIDLTTMLGSNRAYLERQLPQIGQILCSRLADALSRSEAVIVAQDRPEFTSALEQLDPTVPVLDLVRPSRSTGGETDNNRRASWTHRALGAGSY